MAAAARGTREGGGLAIGMNPGTASEVALALRARNPTVLVRPSPETSGFFATIAREARFHVAGDAESAITWVSELIPLLTSGAP